MITRMINLRITETLYIKTWLMGNPKSFLGFFMAMLIGLCSYALHLAERTSPVSCDVVSGRFSTLINSIWCVMITIFTVGYGDISAVTNVGRIISIITGFIGLMNVAILIDVVHKHVLLLSKDEMKVITVVEQSLECKEFVKVAQDSIIAFTLMYVRNWKKKKYGYEYTAE